MNLVEDPEALGTLQLLHRLWTKAVGTRDYVKADWQRLEAQVEALCARSPLPERCDGMTKDGGACVLDMQHKGKCKGKGEVDSRLLGREENLTPEKTDVFRTGYCPDCGTRLLEGPSGGGSINYYCGNESTCGSRFNDTGPFGVERLTSPSPKRSEK
jgi:hypothetical protein